MIWLFDGYCMLEVDRRKVDIGKPRAVPSLFHSTKFGKRRDEVLNPIS
jgi:hypothetical protein